MSTELESLVERLERAVERLEALTERGGHVDFDDDFLLTPSDQAPAVQPTVATFERQGIPMTANVEVPGIEVLDMNLTTEHGSTTLLVEIENTGTARPDLQVEAVLRDKQGSAFDTHRIFFDRVSPGSRQVGDVYMYEVPKMASLDARVRLLD